MEHPHTLHLYQHDIACYRVLKRWRLRYAVVHRPCLHAIGHIATGIGYGHKPLAIKVGFATQCLQEEMGEDAAFLQPATPMTAALAYTTRVQLFPQLR